MLEYFRLSHVFECKTLSIINSFSINILYNFKEKNTKVQLVFWFFYLSCEMFLNWITGFNTGYITWDDEDINNHNEYGGLLPDGLYDSNTKVYYCCRWEVLPKICFSFSFLWIYTCSFTYNSSWTYSVFQIDCLKGCFTVAFIIISKYKSKNVQICLYKSLNLTCILRKFNTIHFNFCIKNNKNGTKYFTRFWRTW